MTAVLLIPNVSMTALASGNGSEVQGSTSIYGTSAEIESGNYSLEDNSAVVTEEENEVTVEKKQEETQKSSEDEQTKQDQTQQMQIETDTQITTVIDENQTDALQSTDVTNNQDNETKAPETNLQKEETVTPSVVIKPDKISKLQVKLNTIQVRLTWKAGTGATNYFIYRSEKKNSDYEKIGETSKLKYTDKDATQGKNYYYRVSAVGDGIEGDYVTSKACRIPEGPKAVKSLKYKAESYNAIKLSWKASKGANKYIIYRSTSKEGNYKKVKTTSDTSFTQKKVKCGNVYYYKVVPYQDKIPGKQKIIKAFTKPETITKLKTSVEDNTIKLTWKKAKGADVYEIYRSENKKSDFEKVGETKKNKFIDENLTYGKNYYYRVYAVANGTKGKKASTSGMVQTKLTGEMRAAWISYLDFQTLKDKSKGEFTRNVDAMYDNVLKQDLNTVIVHVRAFSDAIYPSDSYRWANFITSNDNGPGYDPLEIMIEEAHKKGLSFQAWINPYRTSDGGRVNPASTSAVKKIVAGVEEIVTNYNVDGIHFDDYFYLSTDSTSQEQKMVNVNRMIRLVYDKIKSIRPNVVFGISPAGNIEYARSIGCDVDTWLSESGYVDYILPQLYWSDHYSTKSGATTKMFTNTMKQWAAINKNKTTMYAGLALYKVGEAIETNWGNDYGWGQSRSNLYEQYMSARNAGYVGYSLYRYGSFELPAAREELSNLKKLSK